MKIAILHEMLVKLGWAEKVVEVFLKIFPKADLFTLIYDEKKMKKFFPKEQINSQVFNLKTQKVYNLLKKQRLCLPFMSRSVEQLDFSAYDLVICSSSSFAHWAITKPETKFVVYYHSPSRYLWDWTNEYKRDIWFDKGIKWYFLNKLFLKLRIWDYIASNRNDIRMANSVNVQKRIKKYYKKDSILLYPPVDTKRFWTSPLTFSWSWTGPLLQGEGNKNYYIIISALTEFKKIDIAINWFNKMKDLNLVIIWEGNYRKKLEEMVEKDKYFWKTDWRLSESQSLIGWVSERSFSNNILSWNIQFVWPKYDNELVFLVQNSMWLIFPGEEDFWIVPIEVMAAWKSVFAYNWWGLKETVIAWKTWEFFDIKDWKDFVSRFKKYHKNNLEWKYNEEDCKKQAEKFSEESFKTNFLKIINN